MKNLPDTLKDLAAAIALECVAIDRESRFDDMLDDCYSFEKVGGIFACMSPSRVLKECDPTAYRCGVNDYADGENWTEIDGEYYDTDEAEKVKADFISELETEAETLEEVINDERERANKLDEAGEYADANQIRDSLASDCDELENLCAIIAAVEKTELYSL